MTNIVVQFRIKNFFLNLVGGLWAKGIMTGACFLVNYMTSSSDPTRLYFGSQYVWILRQNTRFYSPWL